MEHILCPVCFKVLLIQKLSDLQHIGDHYLKEINELEFASDDSNNRPQ